MRILQHISTNPQTLARVKNRWPMDNASQWQVVDDVPVRCTAAVAEGVELRYPAMIYAGKLYAGRVLGGTIAGGVMRGGELHNGRLSEGGEIHGGAIFGGDVRNGRVFAGDIEHGWCNGDCYLTPYSRRSSYPHLRTMAVIGENWLQICGDDMTLAEWQLHAPKMIRKNKLGRLVGDALHQFLQDAETWFAKNKEAAHATQKALSGVPVR